MAPGRYHIAKGVGSTEAFKICLSSAPTTTIASLTGGGTYTSGNWKYELVNDNGTVDLVISFSANVDPNSRAWKFNANGAVVSGTSLSGSIQVNENETTDLIILSGGTAGSVTVGEGGALHYVSGGTIGNLYLRHINYGYGTRPIFNATFDGTDGNGALDGTIEIDGGAAASISYHNKILSNMISLPDSVVVVRNGITVNGLYCAPEANIRIESGSTVTGAIKVCDTKDNYGGLSTAITLQNSVMRNVAIYEHEGKDINIYADNTTVDTLTVIPRNTYGYCYATVGATDSVIRNSTFNELATSNSSLNNVTVNNLSLSDNSNSLAGDLTIKNRISGTLNANGHTITLDLTKRTSLDGFMIEDLNGMLDSELRVLTPTPGTYRLSGSSGNIGQVVNEHIIGDLDGVIDIYDANGIYQCGCAVNGETQYIGRYNYTVTMNNNGEMYLNVGWNMGTRSEDADRFDTDGSNDTSATATALTAVSANEVLTIHLDTDVDWFQFTLSSPGAKSNYIGIDFKQVIGDLDLELYAADRTTRLDYARSVTDNERISLEGLAAGTYYVRVYGHSGSVNQYSLVYDLPAAYVWTDDDQYEDNDNKAHSYHLGKITDARTIQAAIATPEAHGASYHNNVATVDEDYFMFQLPKNGKNNDMITLTCDGSMGDLDLYLYGSNGTLLVASSQNTSGGFEQISLSGLKHGVYYVAVKGKTGGVDVGNYELSFSGSEQVLTPDADESNNTIDTAKNLFTLNGTGSREELSLHSVFDEDYYRFSVKEPGSADDWIGIEHDATLGDLDVELYDRDGNLVGASRTAENTDRISLNGLAVGDYYIRVYGNGSTNAYSLNWNITNSSLIAADSYEGMEPIEIRQDQKIEKLSIAVEREEDETRADTFEITLVATGTSDTKIILTDYRSDWADGMSYTLKNSNETIILSGTGSEISLDGCAAGTYTLTVDTPVEDQYTTYSVIAQGLPEEAESVPSAENKWSVFVYMTADNNLIGSYTEELFFMQRAVLQEGVDVYLLLDGPGGNDTRVGKLRHNLGRGSSIEWEELGEQSEWNTGVATTFEAFLDWGLTQAPTGNIALIMKDHGSSLGYNSLDYNGLFKSKNSSVMSISDVAGVLNKQKYDRISVAAFDQCLMGSDVVVATMDGVVDYVVASEANGFTPNQLVMYTKLFESISSDMTSQEVAQKIVDSCNKTSPLPMTLASFHTTGTLSAALEAFGTASAGFTATDWTAICKSFALAHNYGDSICAYSDLGFLLASIKSTRLSISDGLNNAIDALSNALNLVVDSTTMKPESYGSGIAVFNPVLSSRDMSCYTYAPGAKLDYYANIPSSIDAWGDFLATVSEKSRTGLFSGFFSGLVRDLVFTDYSYCLAMPLTAEPGEEASLQIANDLGAFFGNGVEYRGLYLDANGKAYFTISLDEAGIAGDTISVRADNPDANLTVKLVKTTYSDDVDTSPVTTIVATSVNGVLSLAGIASNRTGDQTEYDLIIETDAETSYDLTFGATWSSGSDYFDYKQSGHLGGQGNGTIEKATVLAAGNYGGLVTHSTDADYYRLKTIFTDTLNVTVEGGAGLDVASYDADGSRIDTATYANGKYTIVVANEGYLYVKGSTELLENGKAVDSYSLFIRDVEEEYLEGGLDLDISGMSTNSTPIIEDLSSIDDWEEIDFKVTVDASQAAGTYVLAGGAAGFNKTITVQTADNELGTLSVGGVLLAGGKSYALNLDGNTLSLLVGGLSLTAAAALPNITSVTVSECSSSESPSVFSGVKVTIKGNEEGSTMIRSIVGGLMITAPDSNPDIDDENPIERNIDLTIEGGTFSNMVVGGNNISMTKRSNQYFVTGDTQQVAISGGLFKSTVCAGDRFAKGYLERTGDIVMNISGGTFTSYVGAGLTNAASSPDDGAVYLIGDVSANITGGTFAKGSFLYGGCISSKKEKNLSTITKIVGNVTITVDSSSATTAKPITLTHIVAGSHGWGTITGNVKLVFSGNGDSIVFQTGSKLYGSSSGDRLNSEGKVEKNDASVTGSRILSFTGFHGTLGCAMIEAFSHIEIKSKSGVNSDVTLSSTAIDLSGLENWEFELDSQLSGDFTNNFAGDILHLTGFSELAANESRTLMTDTDLSDRDIFNGFETLAKVQIDNGSMISLTSSQFNSETNTWSFSNYELQLRTSGNTKSMILTKLA